MEITISSHEDLVKACDLLDDATVRDEDIYYNSSAGELTIIAKRNLLSGLKIVKNYILFRKCSYPIIPSKLHLKKVVNYQKITKNPFLKLHSYNVNRFIKKENTYEFIFSEVLKLYVKFQKEPVGSLTDINDNKNERSKCWVFRIPFRFSKK